MRYKVADLRASPFDEPKTVEAKARYWQQENCFPMQNGICQTQGILSCTEKEAIFTKQRGENNDACCRKD